MSQLVNVWFYDGQFNPSNPNTNRIGQANGFDIEQLASNRGNYGAAFWDNSASTPDWKVATATLYASLQDVLEKSASAAGIYLADAWVGTSKLGFYNVAGSGALWPYQSDYQLVSRANRDGNPVYQGWDTVGTPTPSPAYEKGAAEPVLGFTSNLQPPAVLAWDWIIYDLAAEEKSAGDLIKQRAAGPTTNIMYIEGANDQAPIADPDLTGDVRFPIDVTTLIVALSI